MRKGYQVAGEEMDNSLYGAVSVMRGSRLG
jgi:hypothetical protein